MSDITLAEYLKCEAEQEYIVALKGVSTESTASEDVSNIADEYTKYRRELKRKFQEVEREGWGNVAQEVFGKYD